jgi:hypothetical protein
VVEPPTHDILSVFNASVNVSLIGTALSTYRGLYNCGLVCNSCLMNTPARPGHYKHHRFPIEIISHGVWLCCRFCLSYRDVDEGSYIPSWLMIL